MMRILSRTDVRQALSMSAAIEAVEAAFVQLSAGKSEMPVRASLPVDRRDGVTLFMPAYLTDDDRMAVKIVSVFNQNPERGLPLIHALVVVVDATTGAPAAVMEGGYLTALRTGAASGAATDLLAREDAHTAAIFGAGAQGRTQLEAVCAVRPIDRAWVYDLQPDQARAYAGEMAAQLGIVVEVAETPAEALAEADVVCTATTSSTPVFDDADVRPGTHINAVGAYTPEMQEIPPETVLRAKVVIDELESSLAEAGDLIIPIEEGLMTEEQIHAELGQIAAGEKVGRTSGEEVTLFKSVGVAVQDAAVAGAILTEARRLDLGTEVEL
jgi:alanine dehydrogenase